jgi:hypothetical protein
LSYKIKQQQKWINAHELRPINFLLVTYTQALNESEDAVQKDFQPKLHTGEIEAARAQNVSLYVSQQTKRITKRNYAKEDKLGLLLITNFRLSFTPIADDNRKKTYQENTFLAQYDITLSNIDKIYQITDKKSKPIHPNVKNSSRIEAIRIICKVPFLPTRMSDDDRCLFRFFMTIFRIFVF